MPECPCTYVRTYAAISILRDGRGGSGEKLSKFVYRYFHLAVSRGGGREEGKGRGEIFDLKRTNVPAEIKSVGQRRRNEDR